MPLKAVSVFYKHKTACLTSSRFTISEPMKPLNEQAWVVISQRTFCLTLYCFFFLAHNPHCPQLAIIFSPQSLYRSCPLSRRFKLAPCACWEFISVLKEILYVMWLLFVLLFCFPPPRAPLFPLEAPSLLSRVRWKYSRLREIAANGDWHWQLFFQHIRLWDVKVSSPYSTSLSPPKEH